MDTDQDKRTDRNWVIVTLIAWSLFSAFFVVREWQLWGRNEIFIMYIGALIPGFILTFIVVALPFRVLQNVIQPERRKVRIRETVLCILTWLALVNMVYSVIVSYPRDW